MNKSLYLLLSVVIMAASMQGQISTAQMNGNQQSELQKTVANQLSAQLQEDMIRDFIAEAQRDLQDLRTMSQAELQAQINATLADIPLTLAEQGVVVPQSVVQGAQSIANELVSFAPTLQNIDINALANNPNAAAAINIINSAVNNPQELIGLLTIGYTIFASQIPTSINNVLVANPNIPGDAGILDTLRSIVDSSNPIDKQGITALQEIARAAGAIIRKGYDNRNNLASVNFSSDVDALQAVALRNVGAIGAFAMNHAGQAIKIYEKAALVRASDIVQLIKTVRSALESRGILRK